MRRECLLLYPALCGVLTAAPLAAQSLATRRELSALEQQLGALDDSTEVRRHERRLAGQKRDDPLAPLGRVLALLRLDQLGNPWAARQAVGEARSVTKRHADWPVAWHFLGQSYLAVGKRKERDPSELGRRVGFGDYEDAAAVLSRAASLEPTYLPALLDLQRAVALTRDTTRVSTQLLPALRAAADAGVADPAFLHQLGRMERTMGSMERARSTFRAYLNGGGNRGVGLRELAWSSFGLGDSAAAAAYYEGAAEDDSASVAGYREDLAVVGSVAELASFDSTSGADRVAWLGQFWTDRDRRAMRSAGERLAEHYRRLTLVERRYTREVNRRLDSYELRSWMLSRGPVQGSQFEPLYDSVMAVADSIQAAGGAPDVPAWQPFNYFERAHSYPVNPDSAPFDERGRVYIRQGEPDTVISTVAWGVHTNETWFYRQPEGDLMLHFGNVPGDFRLLPSIALVETEASGGEAPGRWFLLNDRCSIWSGYCKMLVWRSPDAQRKLRLSEEAIVAASNAIATGTDSYELRFARHLTFEASAFAVGRNGPAGLVHITWRFRPGVVPVAAAGTEVILPTRIRTVLFDTLGHAVAWGDTTLSVRVRAGDTTVAQVGRVGLLAPPGEYTWRVSVAIADSIGGISPMGSVEVPSLETGTLRLSDLLLAAHGEGVPWIRPDGDTAYVTPRSQWFRDDLLTLYHEIYGLREGESYSSSLSLKRGNRTVLSATFTGIGSFDVTRVYRTLSLKDVSPGDYTVEISVKGERGPWARSSRALTVLKDR